MVQAFEYHWDDRVYNYHHQTAFAVAALKLAGHGPSYPLRAMLNVVTNKRGWADFVDWSTSGPAVAPWWSRISGTLAALATTGTWSGARSAAAAARAPGVSRSEGKGVDVGESEGKAFEDFCFSWLDQRYEPR